MDGERDMVYKSWWWLAGTGEAIDRSPPKPEQPPSGRKIIDQMNISYVWKLFLGVTTEMYEKSLLYQNERVTPTVGALTDPGLTAGRDKVSFKRHVRIIT
jgi:hypothetical protein